MKIPGLVAAFAVALAFVCPAAAAPPHLAKQGTTQSLIVDGKSFLILGGELGNSSASSAAYMEDHWARLKAMRLNTVIAPVYWELIEPGEGKFDWTSVDDLLRGARAHDLKLVLLWFGAWKNSMSTYVPAWVKRDQQRFPRAQLADGTSVEILSAHSPATRDVDARAFAALMAHLAEVDAREQTVLMVQVENEIGMLPSARDRSAVANQLFAGPVPPELVRALAARGAQLEPELADLWRRNGSKSSGTWAQIFGADESGEEVFTAWHYARFAEALVQAGKKKYALPMYANVALNRPNKKPGEYPSGGPLPQLLDVWKAGAPSFDFLAPDIYFPNFSDLTARYRRDDNVLFIPEANNAGAVEAPANAFFAIGELDALGFGPFSIESIDTEPQNPLARGYAVLGQLTPLILANRGSPRMSGFRPRVLFDGTVIDTPQTMRVAGYEITVGFIDPWTPKDKQAIASHGGLIIHAGDDFWIAGQGMIVTFRGADAGAPLVGLETVEEGEFDGQGKWIAGRRLNGDQTHQGRHIRLAPGQFQIQRARLYRYR
jgi:beta-galactosidase GanA